MRRALQLAANGRGFTSPNPMVGAVVVADGRIIGEGWHRCCGGPHAEVSAIRSVCERDLLDKATVYVTLEPCSHFGKTPPCADLLIETGVRRVVVGTIDPNEKVAGRGIERLRKAGIEVTVGVLGTECRQLNRIFMTAHSKRRPYVLLKWACSADGYLDCKRNAGQPAPKFSTPESMQVMHRLRGCFDAIMAGSTTVINDNPRLDTRLYPATAPKKIIVDRRGRISGDRQLFGGEQVLYYSPMPPTSSACEWVKCEQSTGINELLSDLFRRGITSLMVEGGPTLIHSFINSGLWDDARIEMSTVSLGNDGRCRLNAPKGTSSIERLGTNTIIHVKNEQSLITTSQDQSSHSII